MDTIWLWSWSQRSEWWSVGCRQTSGSLLDFDHDEVLVSKSIFENCRNLILVADGIKFDRKAPFLIGNLSQVDIFVTNIQPSKKILKICSTNNVELIDVNTASNN